LLLLKTMRWTDKKILKDLRNDTSTTKQISFARQTERVGLESFLWL
jgi:hypothetical protein